MRQENKHGGARAGWGRWPHLGLGLLALSLAGCDPDELTNLNDPDDITVAVASDTANIEELRNGVGYEFARALTGPGTTNSTPGIIGISGVLTDEMWYASTFQSMQEIDRRNIERTNGEVLTVFQYLHRARNLAERTAEQYARTSKAGSADHAMVTNYAGFTYVLFAENFCSGVPFSSTALPGDVTFGPALTTAQMLDSALVRFNAAAALPGAGAAQQNLARIGRGRALLARGDFAGAAAAVAAVPTTFVYNVPYSENASGQNNGVWYNINSERRSSVASNEGTNGIMFFRRGATSNTIDPRAPADSLGSGIGTSIAHYRQRKYATRGAAVPLATGIEARLIQAEAALNKGASAAYLTTLNELRATVGLAALTDPGNAQARVRQFFSERAFWLWLTAHRLGDMRRMVREYQIPANQVFPVGQTIFGSPYGTDVNFPIPVTEQNNPQAPTGQCIDRNA
ncbi:MAG: hypothetical protein AB1941_14045 [Gemmatimonadota bacterium]